MEVRLRIHAHPQDEALEAFVLERLPEQDLAGFEEHLLICETCQERVKDLDDYLPPLKWMLLQTQSDPKEFGVRHALGKLIGPITRPRRPTVIAAWASAMGAAALLLYLFPAFGVPPRNSDGPAAFVTLAALRGGGEETMARGPAQQPLELSMRLDDLSRSVPYRVEVVTATGRNAWSGPAQVSGATVSARISPGLRAGMYWARLYASNGELLREFGLRVVGG